MTANQIAYQANKIKELEAKTKQFGAETERARQEVETSKHLHDYGHILVPAANSKVESGGQLFGIEEFAKAAKAWNDIAGAATSPFKMGKK